MKKSLAYFDTNPPVFLNLSQFSEIKFRIKNWAIDSYYIPRGIDHTPKDLGYFTLLKFFINNNLKAEDKKKAVPLVDSMEKMALSLFPDYNSSDPYKCISKLMLISEKRVDYSIKEMELLRGEKYSELLDKIDNTGLTQENAQLLKNTLNFCEFYNFFTSTFQKLEKIFKPYSFTDQTPVFECAKDMLKYTITYSFLKDFYITDDPEKVQKLLRLSTKKFDFSKTKIHYFTPSLHQQVEYMKYFLKKHHPAPNEKIGHIVLPSNFLKTWKMQDYSIYIKELTPKSKDIIGNNLCLKFNGLDPVKIVSLSKTTSEDDEEINRLNTAIEKDMLNKMVDKNPSLINSYRMKTIKI